jgi:hypothetical protein
LPLESVNIYACFSVAHPFFEWKAAFYAFSDAENTAECVRQLMNTNYWKMDFALLHRVRYSRFLGLIYFWHGCVYALLVLPCCNTSVSLVYLKTKLAFCCVMDLRLKFCLCFYFASLIVLNFAVFSFTKGLAVSTSILKMYVNLVRALN